MRKFIKRVAIVGVVVAPAVAARADGLALDGTVPAAVATAGTALLAIAVSAATLRLGWVVAKVGWGWVSQFRAGK